jgi:alanine-synthesizing transaminase
LWPIAREHGLVIFADEVYDKVLYDGVKHTPLGSLSQDVLTLTFNSLSKSYRSCGYRAGWMVISGDKKRARDYIEGLNMLSNMRLCANVPGQWAIQTALGGHQSINELVGEGGRLRKQRDLAYQLITAIPGVSCVKPRAALYMFPNSILRFTRSRTTRISFCSCWKKPKSCWSRVRVSTGLMPTIFASYFCPMKTICARPLAALPAFWRVHAKRFGTEALVA